MSEEVESTTVKVKFIREVDYKGAGFAKGVEAELEPHIAARLIASGDAIEVEARAKKTKD